ncbi:MAG: hypothetical protein I8H71_04960 [Xanthomonadaceae bacterium]|nr:hypothetical protein [Xanthomonadaceae bacterium]
MATRSIKANADRIRQIKTFPSLVKYLREELDWPIEADDFEDLTYDWEPEELGIDKASAAKIDEVKQLRPLADDQPWGIFFVKFEPKQLPVVALRRLLNSMVIRKRESANKSERQAWAMNDLMFISSYGDSGERHISFAHFSQPEGKNDLPTLKVLGWDNLDTPLHLDLVAAKLAECLSWPDDEEDINGWRETWQSAFSLRHRETITTAKDLAIRLAALARAIRDRISTALAIENDRGPLTKLMKAFQSALMHDLDAAGFADMYAQTIAYGLLSARIADPSSRTADDLTAHMKTNPFLKELMQTFLHVGGRKGKAGGPGIDFDELGVSEVVELLDDANMEAVIRDFGDKKRDEDPVMHFYESFLHEYNKQLKIQRGVFYTPQPVVSYIVRSVHALLQSEYGLADGLADTTTWGEILKKHPGMKLPPLTDERGEKRTISQNEPFVQILDPATGTATFLVEVIDVIYRTLVAKWQQQRLTEAQQRTKWNEYVPKHLLPRLHAFELMMAPYAIAHMKIGLKLAETGYLFGSDERARIYLTNALDPWQRQLNLPELDALAHEAVAVNEIKRNKHFTVVIGNPPYSVLSANLGDVARTLVDPYKSVAGKKIEERSMLRLEMHLQDDYVKFFALGQSVIRNSHGGIFGFITNNGYLDNLTLRGVRYALLEQFSCLQITDLHGNRLRKVAGGASNVDENVFDIEQGVAIFVGSTITSKTRPVVRKYSSFQGSRTEKHAALNSDAESHCIAVTITPHDPHYFLVPRDESGSDEYDQFISLTDVMPVNISGIVTAHDDLVVDFGDGRLIDNAKILRDPSISDEAARLELGVKDNAGWKLAKARAVMRESKSDAPFLKSYGYRPFDTRRIYYHPAIVWSDRRNVMSHILDGGNVALATCRQLADAPWQHAFVTRNLQDDCFVSNRTRERSYHFPLELRGSGQQRGAQIELLSLVENQTTLNFSKRFLDAHNAISGNTKLSGKQIVSHLFPYIYAVLHSETYRTRYAEFLKIDFPRIPISCSNDLLLELSKLGSELIALHLLESSNLGKVATKFIGSSDIGVEKSSWSESTVWVDKAQSSGFQGVPEEVWCFRIGCYQVCEKWLKDRKGRTLSKDDIAHYQKIIAALSETIRLMAEIDKVIDKHGGWPGAFQTGKAA